MLVFKVESILFRSAFIRAANPFGKQNSGCSFDMGGKGGLTTVDWAVAAAAGVASVSCFKEVEEIRRNKFIFIHMCELGTLVA